jgi:hypothetical protein
MDILQDIILDCGSFYWEITLYYNIHFLFIPTETFYNKIYVSVCVLKKKCSEKEKMEFLKENRRNNPLHLLFQENKTILIWRKIKTLFMRKLLEGELEIEELLNNIQIKMDSRERRN